MLIFGGIFNYIFMIVCFSVTWEFVLEEVMKKCLVLLFCLIAGVAHAFDFEGVFVKQSSGYNPPSSHNFSSDFLLAFEHCTPYYPKVPDEEDLIANDLFSHDAIVIEGQKGDKCAFNIIFQMVGSLPGGKSTESYAKDGFYSYMLKHCVITSEQQKMVLQGIENMSSDRGRSYSKAVANVMDQCSVRSDEETCRPGPCPRGYVRVKD